MKQSHINGSSKNLCYNTSSKSNMEDKHMPFSEKLSKTSGNRDLIPRFPVGFSPGQFQDKRPATNLIPSI